MTPPTTMLGADELVPLLDSLREGIQIIDREWRYVFLNSAAAVHGRKAREVLLGRTMMECYPGIEETTLFDRLREAMVNRAPSALVNEFKYPDGKVRTYELRIEPCTVGLIILSIDVTDGKQLEVQFRHAQKMEAIGRLSGSIAHDFNNLLSVILSCSELVLSGLTANDPNREDVVAVRDAGLKAADLTRQLLTFSRQQATLPRVVVLNDAVTDCEKMLRRLVGEDNELHVKLEPRGAKVRVDPMQISQVVMNLAVNARDAMPKGGRLTLETEEVTLDATYASHHYGVISGPYVMVAVSDTGEGMDSETQARIFEPFFTTKPKGKGTGLGLSTVFGIVQQAKGHIWVYSELGVGTTFKVYFPVAEGAADVMPVQAQTKVLSGHETVLLVEDQDEVRRVAQEILKRLGYQVLTARSPGEAVLFCEQHAEPIHLLLTDVVMPQLSGPELAKRLLSLRPDMKVLFMSGYTDTVVSDTGYMPGQVAYLPKPLLPGPLAKKVREVLDTPVS